jgi:hypothetical protein
LDIGAFPQHLILEVGSEFVLRQDEALVVPPNGAFQLQQRYRAQNKLNQNLEIESERNEKETLPCCQLQTSC